MGEDIDQVKALEEESWIAAMQHKANHLLKRLEAVPPRFFLMETLDEKENWKVLGVIQTQRIHCIENIYDVNWTSEDKLYAEDGDVLHLLRVNTYKITQPQEGKGVPVGA